MWLLVIQFTINYVKHLNCKLYYQQLHLKYLCNLARCWLQAPWGWHDSVETCRSVIICAIIVRLLVIVQDNKRGTVHLLKWRWIYVVHFALNGKCYGFELKKVSSGLSMKMYRNVFCLLTWGMTHCRLRLKCDRTRAETGFRLSGKRTSPFKSAVASVQSTTGSRSVRISSSNDSNAQYTIFPR